MKKHFLFIALIPLLLTGCATTLKVPVTRPAELDMRGAQSLSVLPVVASQGIIDNPNNSGAIAFFNWLFTDDSEERIAREISNSLTTKLVNNGYFNLISADTVKQAIYAGKQPDVDAYFEAEIADYYVFRNEHWFDRTVNGVKERYVEYTDEISLVLNYQIVDSETSQIIGSSHQTIRATSAYYKPHQMRPDPYYVVEYYIDRMTDRIVHQLQPYTETKSIKLMKDKSKNPSMKTADELAKTGQYDMAKDMFLQVYRDTGSLESGYNAGQILLAQMKLDEAESVMSDVVMHYDDKKSIKALNDIRNEKAQLEKLKAQIEKKNNRKADPVSTENAK